MIDEATSAVSADVEKYMYQRAKDLQISLFSVSHRKSLWEHHDHVLMFDGRGAYDFREITDYDRQHAFGS